MRPLHRQRGRHPALSEVFGIFADVVAPAVRTRIYGLYQGYLAQSHVVPNILTLLDSREQFYDIKTLSWGSLYTAHALHPSHLSLVDRRAAQVHFDYLAHARDIDAIITQPGAAPQPGFSDPIEQRLRGYGTVAGLVFGAFGETSAACHALAKTCAQCIAARTWVESGCANFTEAKAAQTRRVYREWGIANALGRARCALTTLSHVAASGSPTQAAQHGVALRRTYVRRQHAYDLRAEPVLSSPAPRLGDDPD